MPKSSTYKKKSKGYAKPEKGEGLKKQILVIFYAKQDIPTSTREIADQVGISWEKANKLLNELFKEGSLQKKRTEGGTTYWKANE